jgi:NADH dehydrogenase
MKRRIVILGGGFGGIYAARGLEKLLGHREDIEITLLSDENFLLFTPMLPEVVSSSIEAGHIISPIRAFFRRVRFLNTQVSSIDLPRRVVVAAHCPRCNSRELAFDHLVLALGSATHFHGIPGVHEYAHPMKTLGDAMALRNHIISVFEHADMEPEPAMRRAMLTFVVAGGGFAGAETVAELHDFARTASRFYSNVEPNEVKVIVVHSGARIMPEINSDLAEYALRKLTARGIEVILNARVSAVSDVSVELTNHRRISTSTLVWTAGVTPSPLLATLTCARNQRGQVLVNEYLEVRDCPGVWALGDCAEVPDGLVGKPCPPTAQHAIRQGKAVAANVGASLGVGRKRQFAHKPLGVLSSLGRRSAVAEICGLKFSGFFAWWLWRTIYLFKLPGLERKVRVALDWTLDLFFPRDTVLLKVFKRPVGDVLAIARDVDAQPGAARSATSAVSNALE